MTVPLSFVPIFRAFDSAGNPLAGGLLYTYAANTLTPKTTWQDAAGTQPNTNPVVLDSTGSAIVRLNGTDAYKFVLTDAQGANQWTVDYYSSNYLVQADIGALLYPQTAAEIAASVTPTNYAYPPGHVQRYGAVPGSLAGAADATTAFQAALSAGYSPQVPNGYYGISSTLIVGSIVGNGVQNLVITGLGNNVNLIKYANVPVVAIQGTQCGLRNVNVFGNYTNSANAGAIPAPTRPSGAPSFTDTTDNITIAQVSTQGTDAPFFWILDQVNTQWAGQDGCHHIDGPGGQVGVLSSAYNARWGFKSEQITTLGGSSIDTAHTTAKYLHCFANGLGTATEGGNIYFQGAEHAQVYYKSFGSFGDGCRVNAFACDFVGSTELDGAVNTAITTWANGQVVAIGAFRRYLKNCYVATTSGTTGATPPTWTTGVQSDGAVSWQFRSGVGLISNFNGKGQNWFKLIFGNGYHFVPPYDTLLLGDSFDGQTVRNSQTVFDARRIRASRHCDFGDTIYTGDYGYLDFIATQGAINTLANLVAGSGYTNGTYTNVPLTGGNGNSATANITVAGGVVTVCTLVAAGANYLQGDILSAVAANIGGTGSGFTIQITALANTAGQYDLAHSVVGVGSPADWFLGRNGSLTTTEPLRVRGDGHAFLADIPVGGRVVDGITANYTLFGQNAGVGDVFFVDCTAGAVTFNLASGGNGALAGRRIIVVKVDSTANNLVITGSGTFNGTAFGTYNVTTQWAYTELIMRSTSGPAWFKKV